MKNFLLRSLLCGVCLFSTQASQATMVAGPITNTLNNHVYFVISPQTWSNAQAEASSDGGHLAVIRNVQENNWIVANVLVDFTPSGGPNLSAMPLWIGLVDPTQNDGSQHASDFVWVTGETNTYRNWQSGEPNNNGNIEYWGAINWHYAAGYSSTPGTWNDCPINGTTGFPGNSTGPYYGLVEIGTDLPPHLSIQLTGPQTVQVSWPTTPGYVLQQSQGLVPSAWSNSALTVTTNAGTNSVTVSPATASSFFRLSNQP